MENYLAPEAFALLLARVMLGILFLLQGYDKVFRMGIKTVIQTISPAFRKVRLPQSLIVLAAIFTSYIELFGGLFIMFGLFKYTVLYLLGIDLLIVAFGLSLVDPVWKMDIVLPRFLLVLFLLLVPEGYDTLALDRLFF